MASAFLLDPPQFPRFFPRRSSLLLQLKRNARCFCQRSPYHVKLSRMAFRDCTGFGSSACLDLALNIRAHLNDIVVDIVAGMSKCAVYGGSHRASDDSKDVSLA